MPRMMKKQLHQCGWSAMDDFIPLYCIKMDMELYIISTLNLQITPNDQYNRDKALGYTGIFFFFSESEKQCEQSVFVVHVVSSRTGCTIKVESEFVILS